MELPVPGFAGDYMPNAAAGVRHVAGIPRYDMEMELRHGLSGGRTVVKAEVEGVRWRAEGRGQVLLDPVDPYEQTGFFGRALLQMQQRTMKAVANNSLVVQLAHGLQ